MNRHNICCNVILHLHQNINVFDSNENDWKLFCWRVLWYCCNKTRTCLTIKLLLLLPVSKHLFASISVYPTDIFVLFSYYINFFIKKYWLELSISLFDFFNLKSTHKEKSVSPLSKFWTTTVSLLFLFWTNEWIHCHKCFFRLQYSSEWCISRRIDFYNMSRYKKCIF